MKFVDLHCRNLKTKNKLGVLVDTCNPRTQKGGRGGSRQVQRQSGLQYEL